MSEEGVGWFLWGLFFGGPAWILIAVAVGSARAGYEWLGRWWRYSPPQRVRLRRHRKRERLAKKLEAMR